MLLKDQFIALILQLYMIKIIKSVPFGGWGPGEGYGNAGFEPPAKNPNAIFGYDFFGVTANRFNYSAIVIQDNVPSTLKDPMFTAMAPRVSKHHRSQHIKLSTPIPRFSDKNRLKSFRNSAKRTMGIKSSEQEKRKIKSLKPRKQHENRTNSKRGRKISNTSVKKSFTASELWKLNRAATKYLTAEKRNQAKRQETSERKKQTQRTSRRTGKKEKEKNFKKKYKTWQRRKS